MLSTAAAAGLLRYLAHTSGQRDAILAIGALMRRRPDPTASHGADGVVVSAMSLHIRTDECRAHPNGTDHFAEAVITGTAVARFADQRRTAQKPSLAVLPLERR